MRPERAVLTGEFGLARAIHQLRSDFGFAQPLLGKVKNACLHEQVERLRGWLEEARAVARDRLLDVPAERPAPTLVLPVDQAEELFNADAGPEAPRFLELLAALVQHEAGVTPTMIVALTIRADRYEPLQTAPQLDPVRPLLFPDLKPMPPAGYTEVISGPARRATAAGQRLNIEPALVERLLAETTEGADALPLLALTLERLYRDFGDDGDLTVAEYESMGGMAQVVQTEVDKILAGDPAERQAQLYTLHDAFIPWLATINPDNEEPMRRLAQYADLPAASQPLIDLLVEKRLLVRDDRDGQTVVEVALESLLRQWDDLAEWLRLERHRLLAAEDIERSASAWQSRDCDNAWLLTGSRLTDAETLAATESFSGRLANTRDYLAASRHNENQRIQKEEEQRQAELRNAEERRLTAETHAADLRRRARALRTVLGGMAVVVLIIAGVVHIFVTGALHRDLDNQLNSRARLLIESGSLDADPGRAIEGTAYSDVNAMLVNPGRSVYTANQEGQTLPLGEPEKNVMQGNLLMSLRTANHQRVLALHLTNGSTLLISKPMTPTEHLVRQLDIMSVVIGGIGVAIAAVASAAVTRARRAARSLCADSA